jgi:long-chain acyl-CoA synthetase
VVIEKGSKTIITEEQLKSYCAGKLAMYKVPRYIEFTEKLKINSAGKKIKVFDN